MTRHNTTPTDEHQEAVDRASRVFGWQHLVRYSGQTDEWMAATLGAIVLAARGNNTAHEQLQAVVAAVKTGVSESDITTELEFTSGPGSLTDAERDAALAACNIIERRVRAALSPAPTNEEES